MTPEERVLEFVNGWLSEDERKRFDGIYLKALYDVICAAQDDVLEQAAVQFEGMVADSAKPMTQWDVAWLLRNMKHSTGRDAA